MTEENRDNEEQPFEEPVGSETGEEPVEQIDEEPDLTPDATARETPELEQTEPDEKTDVAAVFPELARQIRRRGMIVLFSDLFLPIETLAESLKQFRLRRHEVIVFHVMHDDELTFPFEDNTLFRGLEDPVQLHAEPRALRRSDLEAVERFLADVRRTCASAGVDYVLMNTSEPLEAVLGGYLTFRQKIRRTARHS